MDTPADPATPFAEVYQSFLDDLALEVAGGGWTGPVAAGMGTRGQRRLVRECPGDSEP